MRFLLCQIQLTDNDSCNGLYGVRAFLQQIMSINLLTKLLTESSGLISTPLVIRTQGYLIKSNGCPPNRANGCVRLHVHEVVIQPSYACKYNWNGNPTFLTKYILWPPSNYTYSGTVMPIFVQW